MAGAVFSFSFCVKYDSNVIWHHFHIYTTFKIIMGRKKKDSSIGKKVRRNLTLTLVQNFVHKVVIFTQIWLQISIPCCTLVSFVLQSWNLSVSRYTRGIWKSNKIMQYHAKSPDVPSHLKNKNVLSHLNESSLNSNT